MNKKLILWISFLFMGKLISMNIDGQISWDLLPVEIKFLIFEYVTGRYDLDQINKAINTLSKVNKEMRYLTFADPKLCFIKTIRANFCKKVTDLTLNFNRGNESLFFMVEKKSYIAQFNLQNSADVRQKNIEVAQVIGMLNQQDLNIFIKDLVLKLRDKTDEELLLIAMTLAQPYIYSQMNHNTVSAQNIKSIAKAIFDLFKCKENLSYKNKVTFGLM